MTDKFLGSSSSSSDDIFADVALTRNKLGLRIGANIQSHNSKLDGLSGLTLSNNKIIKATGSSTFTSIPITTDGENAINTDNPLVDLNSNQTINSEKIIDQQNNGNLGIQLNNGLGQAVKTFLKCQSHANTTTSNKEFILPSLNIGSNSDTLCGLNSTQTLTNKTISASNNTITGLNNTNITNGANYITASSTDSLTNKTILNPTISSTDFQNNASGNCKLFLGESSSFIKNDKSSADISIQSNRYKFLLTNEGYVNNATPGTPATAYQEFAIGDYNNVLQVDKYSNTMNLIRNRNNFQILKDTTTQMLIDANGKVGIATTPGVPLHIGISNSYSSGLTGTTLSWFYYASNGTLGSGTWGGGEVLSIISHGGIWVQNGRSFVASSDSRIKEDIVDVPDNLALEMVRNIPCRYYKYKDKRNRREGKTIGFIAQEVEKVLPMAVNVGKNIIPNEMRTLTNVSWNGNILYTDLSDCSGIKYRFYVSNDPSGDDEIMKEVVGNSDNTFTFDRRYNNVFCYGKEVDDFHTLDKQKIFTLHHSAIQELDKEIQLLKEEIKSLKG